MRKFCYCFLIIVLFFSCASVTAYAWRPSYSFNCEVKIDKIPNGTKYIDMLMPISENDKYYVSCNSDNCKVFSIPEKSEIVSYNTEGYRSYTFHISDAYSLMQPEVAYRFNISEKDYNTYKELLKPYDDKREFYSDSKTNERKYVWEDGFMHYNILLYLKSQEYTDYMKSFSQVKQQNLYESKATVDFNTNFFINNHNYYSEDRSAKCDYEYCRSTYKKVKFAYIDENGHILGVSNEVSVYEKSFSTPQLQLQLSGLTLTNSFRYSPQYTTFRELLLGIGVLLCGGLVVILVKVINRRNTKRGRNPA